MALLLAALAALVIGRRLARRESLDGAELYDVSLFRPWRGSWQVRVGVALESHPYERTLTVDLGPWSLIAWWRRRWWEC